MFFLDAYSSLSAYYFYEGICHLLSYTYLSTGVCLSTFHLQAYDDDKVIIIIIAPELSIAVALWFWLHSSRLRLERDACKKIFNKGCESCFHPKTANEAS